MSIDVGWINRDKNFGSFIDPDGFFQTCHLLFDVSPHLSQPYVVFCDGKTIVGRYRGSDKYLNIVLSDAHERIYSLTSGVEQEPRGLYVIKGDNVAMFGELDEEKEMQIDLSLMRGTDFKPVNHGRKIFF